MTDGYLSKDRAYLNKGQRERRARYRRIDYYPGKEAQAVIDRFAHRYAGSDYSSVMDALVIAGVEELPE